MLIVADEDEDDDLGCIKWQRKTKSMKTKIRELHLLKRHDVLDYHEIRNYTERKQMSKYTSMIYVILIETNCSPLDQKEYDLIGGRDLLHAKTLTSLNRMKIREQDWMSLPFWQLNGW